MAIRKRRTMLKVRHTRLQDRIYPDIYSGEQSPYWNYCKQDQEYITANPDLLSEEMAMYFQAVDDNAPIKIQVIREGLPLLTIPQRQALYLCGVKGLSQLEAAKVLHCTQQSISGRIEKARRKIMKIYLHNVSEEK